jgi:flagellar hook-length control protein FliK
MILMPPVLDAATPLPTSSPSSRPEPAGVGRSGRPDPASKASFRDELRAVEAVQRESAPADTDLREGRTERADSGSAAAPPAECACERRDETRSGETDPQSADALMAALLQALSAMTAEAVDAPVTPASGADAAQEEQGQAPSELLELLQEIQKAQEALGSGTGERSGIASLLEKLNALTSGNAQAALPGKVHQMLRELREHLSGIAWGQALKAAPAAAKQTPPESLPSETAPGGTPPADPALAAAGAGEETPAVGARGLVQAEADKGSPSWKAATGRRAAAFESASGSGRTEASQVESTERPAVVATAPVRSAGQRQEMPASPDAGSQAGQDAGRAPDPGVGQPAGGTRMELRTSSAEEVPPAETADPATPVEQAPADARLTRVHDGRLERTLEAGAAAGKDKEAAGAARTGVFDQIVQRAVLQVKNEQSEIKIDLKPEFLGNVRMQIVTENQQVSVRILTEAPAVRDMIETGLQQLRSELQSQGLQVDRLEVSVSEDYREPRHRQGKAGERGEHARVAAVDETDRSTAADRMEPAYFRQRPSARRSTVDMFV